MLEQPRSTQRHELLVKDDEQALTNDIVELATRFGRYGYRRITALLRGAGWEANHKRVERIWRREGLKVPARQPRRGRLWLNDGSTISHWNFGRTIGIQKLLQTCRIAPGRCGARFPQNDISSNAVGRV